MIISVVGCSNKQQRVINDFTDIYSRNVDIVSDIETCIDTLDAVLMEDALNDIEELQNDVENIIDKYKEGSEEYLLFNEFYNILRYENELAMMTDSVLENPMNAMLLDQNTINNYINNTQMHIDKMRLHAENLGIDVDNIINSTQDM